uniref:nicotinate-nicotinamide nucleotide adenylyltransferase n=1 Tax=Thaumasiovibrio occultus TaxID=1891184 RepID=UPI000B34C56B|nr:nicotinate-nicotinamide nucleotide adenylyltransferase [Thaumasiovibrio occultus]
MTKNIAVFGSAFNPPSLGHASVLKRLSMFDQVLLLPSAAHAWGKKMLPFDIRCQLVDAFITDLQLANLSLSTLEAELLQQSDSVTTFAVLTALQERDPEATFTFVLGPDNLLAFNKFYRSDDILQRWNIMACPQTVNIRSTMIRDAIAQQDAIDAWVTPGVAALISHYSLYQEPA